MTTDNKLKQISNIYELPLLLQVSGYKLQLTAYGEVDIVECISFYKDHITFIMERLDQRHIFLGPGISGTFEVPEDDLSSLIFNYWSGRIKSTWFFNLVPETNNHPNILEAFQNAVPFL